MRHQLTISLITILGIVKPILAQQGPGWVIQNANKELRFSFQHLNPPTYSNKLYHMAVHQVPEDRFVSNSDSVENIDIWWAQYSEMYYTAYDTTLLPSVDVLFAEAIKPRFDTVPIMVMDFNFHKFIDSNVFNVGTYFIFDTLNNVLFDKPNRPSSPYVSGNLFKGANFKESVSFADPVFKIDPQFILYDQFTSSDFRGEYIFQIDFGDGNGFQTFNTNSITNHLVTYNSIGEKIITYRIFNQGSNTTIKKAKSSIYVESDLLSSFIDLNPTDFSIPNLDIQVHQGCDVGPKKALIFLTGYDPLNQMSHDQWYQDYLFDSELNDVLDYSYDIYVVKYDDSNIDLRVNALAVTDLLQRLKCNEYYKRDEQFVVLGYSMGGLIGRYALSWMEQPQNINYEFCKADKMHNTRLFISADAPQQGANMPLSVQYLYNYSASVVNTLGLDGQYMEFFRDHVLDSYASKQMLLLHHSTRNAEQYTEHAHATILFDELNQMGDYPQYCKKVAFAHGMMDGTRQINEFTDDPKPIQAKLLASGWKMNFTILFLKFNLYDASVHMYTNPKNVGPLIDINAELFTIKLKVKIFGLKIKRSLTDWVLDHDGKNLHPICTAPGSFYGVSNFLDNSFQPKDNSIDWAFNAFNLQLDINGTPIFGINGAILGFEFWNGPVISDGFSFNFIPTNSALDINRRWDTDYLKENFTNYNTSYLMSLSPFDVIVGGTITNGQPYNTLQSNDVVWDIDQNNDHLTKFRNENVLVSSENNEVGWLLREIGDERLWLENYTLNWGASYTAPTEIASGHNQFPYYNYPSVSSPPIYMAGAYSKENAMQITPTGVGFFRYDQNTGVFTNNGLSNFGSYYEIQNIYDFCDSFAGYFAKNGLSNLVEDYAVDRFNIYPNPTYGDLTIPLSSAFDSYIIFDNWGRPIQRGKVLKRNALSFTLHLDNLPKGVYHLRLKGENYQKNEKFIKL